jgi:hypothetical protein
VADWATGAFDAPSLAAAVRAAGALSADASAAGTGRTDA